MSGRKATGDDTAEEQEPELKRRRLLRLDAGGPIEDDETARQKMRDAKVIDAERRGAVVRTREDDENYGHDGFDPDNVRDVKELGGDIRPMGYFAYRGDLPMMRWLYINGADTRDLDIPDWNPDFAFPLLNAIDRGQLDACKWLFEHGAAADIKRTSSGFRDGRPLSVAFAHWSGPSPSVREVSRWLILRGALCQDGTSGKLDVDLMREDLNRPDIIYDWPGQGPKLYTRAMKERRLLLEWANDLHQARSFCSCRGHLPTAGTRLR